MKSKAKPINETSLIKLFHTLALLLLTLTAAYLIFNSFSSGQTYGIMLAAGIVILGLLLFPSYAAVLAKNSTATNIQRKTALVSSSIVTIITLLLAFGALQDLAGVTCSGLIGSQQSCLQSWAFWLSYYAFMPPVLIVLFIILIFLNVRDKPKK